MTACPTVMKLRTILIILFSASLTLIAQETNKDTVRLHLYELQNPSIIIYDDFDLDYLHLNPEKAADPGSIKLYSSYLLSSLSGDDFFSLKTEPDILSSYHKLYLENSRISAIQYVLGMAQLGAVGYLAYKHFKKYGFK